MIILILYLTNSAFLTPQDLKTHVQLLEDLREQVRDEDMARFEKKVEPTRKRILTAVEEFLQLDTSIPLSGLYNEPFG